MNKILMAAAAALATFTTPALAQETPDCNTQWENAFNANAADAKHQLMIRLEGFKPAGGTWQQAATAYEGEFRKHNETVPLLQSCPQFAAAVIAFTGVTEAQPAPAPPQAAAPSGEAAMKQTQTPPVANAAMADAVRRAETATAEARSAKATAAEALAEVRSRPVVQPADLTAATNNLATATKAYNTAQAGLESLKAEAAKSAAEAAEAAATAVTAASDSSDSAAKATAEADRAKAEADRAEASRSNTPTLSSVQWGFGLMGLLILFLAAYVWDFLRNTDIAYQQAAEAREKRAQAAADKQSRKEQKAAAKAAAAAEASAENDERG